MSVLVWEKPKKRLKTKEWKEDVGFEDGPTGGYAPNMSEDDNNAWKAKITGQKLGYPQVEIRKSAGGSLMLIIVNLGDGYTYKHYRADGVSQHNYRDRNPFWDLKHHSFTAGMGLHMSMNGPSRLTVDEMLQLPIAIEEAKAALNGIVKVPGDRQHYAAWLDSGTDTAPIKAEIEDMGGKTTVNRPEFNVIYFTAPKSLIDPISNLHGIKAIFLASKVEEIANSIDDFRKTPEKCGSELEVQLQELDMMADAVERHG